MKQAGLIDSIRERVDIVELVREYVPALKKAGKTYKACCPFHSEKTPSFTVNQEKGLFYCFGCQEGGDIFDFLMKIEHLSFAEAGEKLAVRAGLEWKAVSSDPAERLRIDIKKALEFAAVFYRKNLLSPAGSAARKYLAERQVKPETAEKFMLGFSSSVPAELFSAARRAGIGEEVLVKAALAVNGTYGMRDSFRGRIMFPIVNHRGENIGFGGRAMGEAMPKYLNSAETVLFSKSKVLFGIHTAADAIRRKNLAVLLEGYMDVIVCQQEGIGYAVAPLGTAVTAEHARVLKRYTEQVVMLFDPDAAGIKASLRGALVLTECGLFVKVAILPEKLDPDEFILKYGRQKLEAVIDGAVDLIRFQAESVLSSSGRGAGALEKSHLASELAQTIARQPDDIIRTEWTRYASDRLGVEEAQMRERVQAARAHQPAPVFADRVKPRPMHADVIKAMPIEERDLLRYVLRYPQHCGLCAELAPEDFSDPRLHEYLTRLRELAAEHAPIAVVEEMAAAFPDERDWLVGASVAELPAELVPEREIKNCVARIRAAALRREFGANRKLLKDYARQGKDTAGIVRRQNELIKLMTAKNLKR